MIHESLPVVTRPKALLTALNTHKLKRRGMDDLGFYCSFYSISVISSPWKGDDKALCHEVMRRIPLWAGLELSTSWSDVCSANRLPTRRFPINWRGGLASKLSGIFHKFFRHTNIHPSSHKLWISYSYPNNKTMLFIQYSRTIFSKIWKLYRQNSDMLYQVKMSLMTRTSIIYHDQPVNLSILIRKQIA